MATTVHERVQPPPATARAHRREHPRAGTAAARRQWWGIVYAAPALAMVALFFVVPLAGTVWTSLQRKRLYGPGEFVGLSNFRAALHDGVFWTTLGFTARFALVTTAAGLVVSLSLALLVRRPGRASGALRTALFVPVTMGYAAAGFLWFYLLDGRVGVVDDVLARLGLIDHPVQWLASEPTAFWSIAVMTVWKSAGFGMVILLIGMQSVPGELYEAFEVDGASALQTLLRLTLPLLRRSLLLVLVLGVAGGMLTFDQFYAMTKGGPSGSTVTAVYDVFLTAFSYQQLGYGSALALVVLLVLALVSTVQLVLFRRSDS